MKTIKTFLFIVLALGLFLAGCRGSSPDPVTVTDQDAGKTVSLHKGDTLVVTLEGNPTTGYNWENTLADQSVLQQKGEPEFVADSQALGAGGKISLAFEAVSAGQTDLTLVYHRSWEKGVEPLETYQVTVVVK